jgi:hypothetical protein
LLTRRRTARAQHSDIHLGETQNCVYRLATGKLFYKRDATGTCASMAFAAPAGSGEGVRPL